MIKRLLVVDGVNVVCKFRDDGVLVEGYGVLTEAEMGHLAKFAHDYKRIVQGNADQLSMFTQLRGWTPPAGWVVRGQSTAACSVGNLVCVVDVQLASLTEVMRELTELSHW